MTWFGEHVCIPAPRTATHSQPLCGASVCLVLGASTGGIGRHVRALVEALGAEQAEVTVAGPAETLSRFGYAGLGARAVPAGGQAGWSQAGWSQAAWSRAGWSRLRSAAAGADLVHAHGVRAGLLARAAVSPSVPFVLTLHNAPVGGALRRGLYAAVERQLVPRTSVVLGVSRDLVHRAEACGGRARLAAVGAARLPAPSRPAAQIRAELGAGERALLVCVARLAPQKGLDDLIDAASLLARHPRRPVVVIAGEGPLRAHLAARIAASPAPVRLLGTRSDVADLLAAADLAVLPSHWEGSPLAAHEALQAGCPLVATDVGGVRALTGHDAAVLVPPGKPGTLARAIAGLLDHPAAAQAFVRQGFVRAWQWPDAADSAAQVLDVYRELLG